MVPGVPDNWEYDNACPCVNCYAIRSAGEEAHYANKNNFAPFIFSPSSMFSLFPAVILFEKEEELPRDESYDETFGWRNWRYTKGKLYSPVYQTCWETEELYAEGFDPSEEIRNVGGIHAKLVPKDWRKAECQEVQKAVKECLFASGPKEYERLLGARITGIVERYGKYELGTVGWRAEHVIIRKLHAPTTEIALALEQQYPLAEVSCEEN